MRVLIPIYSVDYANYGLFDKYHKYTLSIQEILQGDGDYDTFKKKLPDQFHYLMDNKLDQILDSLKKKYKLC